jgi:hypothetical protein
MTHTLDLTADVINIDDIIERYEELEALLGNEEGTDEGWEGTDEEWDEFAVLQTLMADLRGNGGDEEWRDDWYPTTLIRDSYFVEAMDEMVGDCYDLPKDLPSFMTITLDYVALQMDYTSTEIDGVTYWYR